MEREKLTALVRGAQEGSENAMNDLFNAFYNDIYFFALKTVKDEDLAGEITQDTFVKVIETIGTLQEPAAFVTWMKQITYHLCLGHFKKKKELLVDEDEDGYSVFDTLEEDRTEFVPDKALDQRDFRATILAMLDQLSPEQRAAAMLYYYNELSVKEIAQIQGVSEGTVKSRLNYARKSIKTSVERYEKKHNIKLHCLGMFPLFNWLFGGEGGFLAGTAAVTVAANVAAATGVSVTVTAAGATAGTAAAAGTAVATGTGLLSVLTALPVAVKITVAAIVGVVIIGGAGAAVLHTQETAPENVQETVSVFVPEIEEANAGQIVPETTVLVTEFPTAPEPLQTEPAETIPMETKPEPTEPKVTEPEATKPVETEPEVTEPETTEPVEPEPEVTEPEVTEPEVTEPTVVTYIVPEGCTYITADGTTITAGNPMPDTVLLDDQFITEEYTYEYVSYFRTDYRRGWNVVVNDKTKTSYGEILKEINGKPIIAMIETFLECKSLHSAPRIPDSVETLYSAFYGCTNLRKAPEIPVGVTNMENTFSFCTNLSEAPEIPYGVTNMWQTFLACENLVVAPELPDTVDLLYHTFMSCYALRTAPEIPEGVTYLDRTFEGCTSLVHIPGIHQNVTGLNYAFSGCTSLEIAPVLPDGLTRLDGAFEGCTSLVAAPVIPGSVTSMKSAFEGCTSLLVAPEIPDGVTSLYKTFHGCSALTDAPEIPNSVINMERTFYGCSSLNGTVVIHANPTDYSKCFDRTQKEIYLSGSSTMLEELAGTAQNYNVAVIQLEQDNEM